MSSGAMTCPLRNPGPLPQSVWEPSRTQREGHGRTEYAGTPSVHMYQPRQVTVNEQRVLIQA